MEAERKGRTLPSINTMKRVEKRRGDSGMTYAERLAFKHLGYEGKKNYFVKTRSVSDGHHFAF
jgi:hypothetical protein